MPVCYCPRRYVDLSVLPADDSHCDGHTPHIVAAELGHAIIPFVRCEDERAHASAIVTSWPLLTDSPLALSTIVHLHLSLNTGRLAQCLRRQHERQMQPCTVGLYWHTG